jgi:acyl transferase domain-containing protein
MHEAGQVDEVAGRRVALIFPGQGSPLDGGAETVAAFAPELAKLAEEMTGSEPFAAASSSTRFAQPAIYCLGIARWIAAGSPVADFHAGHSLGDLTALTVAGAWSLTDGLRVVCERGRLMEEAGSAGESMLALRVGPERAAEIAAATGVVVANDNGPAQQVLSGSRAQLREAASLASGDGIKSMELPVAGAFHSPSMASAAGPFRCVLDRIPPSRPARLVYSSRSAAPFGRDVAAELTSALAEPVRWRELVQELIAEGAGRFVEPGPGRPLGNLVRRIEPKADVSALQVPSLAGTGVGADD